MRNPLITILGWVWMMLAATATVHGVPKWQWQEVGALPGATVAHTATALANGEVLVSGGYGKLFGRVPIAAGLGRLYNPQTQQWRATQKRLHYGRLGHAAIRLSDGRVLIVGGKSQDKKPMRSVELYDPGADSFSYVADMAEARDWPRLTRLAHGRILITGDSHVAEVAEIGADGGVRLRTITAKLQDLHHCHLALLGLDGMVYLIGGRTRSITRFDSVTETFTRCKAQLPKVFDDQAGAVLRDGRFFIAGGQNVYTNRCVCTTWFYDSSDDELTAGPTLNPQSNGQIQPGASDMMLVDLYPDDAEAFGRHFLLCGGEYDSGSGKADQILDSAWIFDAEKKELLDVGPMRHGHDDFAAVSLGGQGLTRRVLIIGGHGFGDTFENHCEVFTITLEP